MFVVEVRVSTLRIDGSTYPVRRSTDSDAVDLGTYITLSTTTHTNNQTLSPPRPQHATQYDPRDQSRATATVVANNPPQRVVHER